MPAKLQLPDDEAVKESVTRASALAEAGDFRAAQKALKDAVACGALPAATQRQIISSWSAGCFSFHSGFHSEPPKSECLEVDAQGTAGLPSIAEDVKDKHEQQITRIMRERGVSHEIARTFIISGGVDVHGPGGLAETDGEITEEGLKWLMEGVARRAGFSNVDSLVDAAAFVDIGSGKGRCVLAAAEMWPSLRSIAGVELMQSRHEEAMVRLSEAKVHFKEHVHLVHGDLFKVSLRHLAPHFSDHRGIRRHLILANTLCFGEALQAEVIRHLESQFEREDEVFLFCSGWPLLGTNFRREYATWYEAPIPVTWKPSGIPFQVSWLPPSHGALHLDAWDALIRDPMPDPLSEMSAREHARMPLAETSTIVDGTQIIAHHSSEGLDSMD